MIAAVLPDGVSAEKGNAGEKVVLQLAWKHQFQFAGYYAALDKGYYNEAGLDVVFVEGGSGRFAREALLKKQAHYGIAGSELVIHRFDGDPFVVLAPIFQHSPSILLTKAESGISSLQDLIGKKVMLLPGKKDADILAAFLNEGVPHKAIDRLDQTFDLNDLINGKTDAVSAYMTNEPWQLEQKGIRPKSILPLTYGVDFYSDCLFTTEQEVNDNPVRVSRFLEASIRGWEYAMANPEEIVDLIINRYKVTKKRDHLLYEAESIRKLMLPDLVQIGHMNPGRWQHIAATYEKLGMIKPGFSLGKFLYSPGAQKNFRVFRRIIGSVVILSIFIGLWVFFLMSVNSKLRKEINERARVESKLKISERRFRKIIEAVSEISIYGFDEDYRVIFWNRASARLYGYSEQEAVGQLLESLIIPDALRVEFRKTINDWANNNKRRPACKVALVDKTGRRISVFSSHVMLETPDRREFFSIDIDLGPIQTAEEEKIKAQKIAGEHEKLALVGQIAGKMAHDFNNILGIIMGNAELAFLDTKDPESGKVFKLILNQTLRGKNLTKQLIAFAKDQEPKQSFFSLNEKLDLVISLMRKDLDGINIVTEEGEDIPELLADSGMIENVLVNLILNSVHAICKTESPKIIFRTWYIDDLLFFEIEDNGCGIPEKYIEKIYDPSFTLKGNKDISNSYNKDIKGTGYGMSNVRKYIEKHNGSVSCEVASGSGTIFRIVLPVTHKELTDLEKLEICQSEPQTGKHILLVEDEADISGIQFRLLTSDPFNHKVDIASDGQMAIDMFEADKYDIISLDYYLSGSLNGMHVYNHIRTIDTSIPVVFISGNIEFIESIIELQRNDSNIDHLSKPCQNKEYVCCINKQFSAKG